MTLPIGSDGACIQEIFERQAAAAPERIALTYGGARLTYRELNERANQVAHLLRRHGVGPDVFVGLCLERSIDLIVALLGILKAGGAYVPIDPQYPADRRAFMLEDSKAPLILTQRSLAHDVTVAGAELILMDRDSELIAREPTAHLESTSSSEHLAYVIYTSGSTGTPKGTMISHRNVVRLFSSTDAWFNFGASEVWTLFHSCAFDFSVWEIWGALFYGGTLVIVPFDVSRTPDSFWRLLRDEKVTVLNQTPSAFRQLVRADESHERGALALRLVIFGGEALDFSSLKPWFERHGDQQPRLVNMYGITETTVHVTYRPVSSTDVGSNSVIGEPIPDLDITLKDDAGNPVPVGQAGEIYVGGAGVSRGYLNRPELTAQKFVADPSASDPRRRAYRSGDLGRYLPNGDLEYLGRIDLQVKIRGFRIELGEISAAIDAHPAIRESAVLVHESIPGEKSLAAYVVKRSGQEVSTAALRHRLRERLPEYMVPAAFLFLEALPLTVNGKLDVKTLAALPFPAAQSPPAQPATGNDLERGIAAIWRDVLQVPAVGLEQNFFDVGGNSGNLALIHERLQHLLERRFSITDLYAHSTVRALAAHFAAGASPDQGGGTPRPGGPRPDAPGPSGAGPTNARLRAERQRKALAAQRELHREPK